MKCPGCTKKCNTKHCAYVYNLIEACQSGKPFKRVDDDTIFEYRGNGFFRYMIDSKSGKVYDPSQDDFLAEYMLTE